MLNDESIIPHQHGEWPYRRSRMLRYSVALLAVFAAFSVRYLIYADLETRLVFTFFVPAAILAVWFGGLGPGVFATLLGLVLGEYIFYSVRGALFPLGPLGLRESIGLGVFGVTTLMCVMLCENLHRKIRRRERLLAHVRHAWQFPPGAPELHADALLFRGGYRHRPLVLRYGLTVAVVMVAFLLRYWLFGTQDPRLPFIVFAPAAMVAAWYGGLGAGLLATAAGLLLGDYFFLSAHEALGAVGEVERLLIGLYTVTSVMCVLLFETLHERIIRLEHAIERAEQHVHGVHLQVTDVAPAGA